MFTVIICDKHIINDCYHKYHIYLKPFFDSDKFAFCEWYADADNLDDALPGLRDIIRHKKEWRAIVVNDSSTWGLEAVNKSNPFNFVDSVKRNYNFSSFDDACAFRAKDEQRADAALSNPLTKLSIWLCGAPTTSAPILCYADSAESFEAIKNNEEYVEFLNSAQLKVSEVEEDRSRDMRFKKLSQTFVLNGELFNPPKSVITIAERIKNIEAEMTDLAWTTHTEFDYSQFYIDNLYPEKLRYLIFDVSYIRGCRNESQYFNFLTSVLMLATYDCPNGALRSNRVYRVNINIDVDRVRELCNKYNSKLWSTLARIDEISEKIKESESQPIDKHTAEECFESNIFIPIDVVNQESRKNLMAKFNKIGLSKDCPGDEYTYWDEQYHAINKYFIRFLREPRRAVKSAAKDDLRSLFRIDDERALRLNEFQKEDVLFILEEEECNMVATSTTRLFDTAHYNQQIREADKEIRRAIAQRMTKSKTIFYGGMALLAYFVGFLPMIFSNLNTTKSFLFSLLISGVTMAVFAIIGFVYLFIRKRKLINRFKHFNYTMSGILNEIEKGVNSFAHYLSHTCNVMREFSVLNFKENAYKQKQNILSNHKRIIMEKIKEVNELFGSYINSDDLSLDYEVEPYSFDFTVLGDYEYVVPYSNIQNNIEFLQEGNSVVIPVDYVENITVIREELYD